MGQIRTTTNCALQQAESVVALFDPHFIKGVRQRQDMHGHMELYHRE